MREEYENSFLLRSKKKIVNELTHPNIFVKIHFDVFCTSFVAGY